jgi:hypothetical protein
MNQALQQNNTTKFSSKEGDKKFKKVYEINFPSSYFLFLRVEIKTLLVTFSFRATLDTKLI